jgi:cell division protein FtsW (lipid II flippase)
MYNVIIKLLAVALVVMYGSLFYLAYDIISKTTEYNFATLLVLGCILYITFPLFKLIFYAGFFFVRWCYEKIRKTPK